MLTVHFNCTNLISQLHKSIRTAHIA